MHVQFTVSVESEKLLFQYNYITIIFTEESALSDTC